MNKKKNIEDLILELREKITLIHFEIEDGPNEDIFSLFFQVVESIIVDYHTYRKFIPSLLDLLEQNRTTSINILINSFLVQLNRLLKNRNLDNIDTSILSAEYGDDVVERILSSVKAKFKEGALIRISDFDFDKSGFSENDKKGFLSFIVDFIQDSAETIVWDEERVYTVMLQLALARNLLIDQNDPDTFYVLSAMVLDRFSTSGLHQQARDVSEELILSSYIDRKEHLGYFNSFRCYSNNSSAVPALLYANLSILCALKRESGISSKYVKDIIWQGIKFFRNVSFLGLVKEIYESIPHHITFSPYEKRSIAHSYFTSLLIERAQTLPSLVLDFLNEHREEIYNTGVHDAFPWLVTLYNIKRIYPNADFSATGLGHYLSTFEMIVPTEIVSPYKAMIDGDINKLKPVLKESLIKLNDTRSKSDIVNDNEMSIKIASRLVDEAIQNDDYEALLLAMMVKSDFSFIFSEKERKEIAPMVVPEISIESFERIYGSEKDIISHLEKQIHGSFIWLIISENKFYQLTFEDGFFQSYPISTWDIKVFNQLVKSGFFSTLSFDDSIKTKYEVRSVLPEEFVQQSIEYLKRFDFFRIKSKEASLPLFVVMDMDLAGFPHNLILNQNGNLIHFDRPIANILSTEWYIKYSGQTKIAKNYSKSIWIPTEGGDFTLNQLFGKMEDILDQNRFNVLQGIDPKSPIDSDLNIICAHGANDIALKQVIFPDSSPRLNLDRYLSNGKVLIFFVCHSGSISSTPFENSISSIVKRYIAKGYKSVIAPFWALHINIPPIWLPVFIKSIEEGKPIVQAVHEANLKVHESFPTLAAWCYYNTPHLLDQRLVLLS